MNQRRILILILLLLSFILTAFTVFSVASGDLPTISGRAFSLYLPQNKEFILEKNADTRLPMASTTKIMTALIALEYCDLDETVQIPKDVTNIEGSSIYLREGEVISVRDLIYSVLLQSANDAAQALAIKISGDIDSFSELMNQKAIELGLTDTSFENPHGLDSEGHYTTARDLALIAAKALENPTFKKICSTYKYSFRLSDSERHIVNHNKLLKRYDGAIGVKTGYTSKSGRCLVSAAERDGLTLIAVTLDAPDDWRDHKNLLDYGFSNYEALPLESIIDLPKSICVVDGKYDTASLRTFNEQKYVIKKKSDPFPEPTIEMLPYITAPVTSGQSVGRIYIKQNNKIIFETDIVTDEKVDKKAKKPFFKFIFD